VPGFALEQPDAKLVLKRGNTVGNGRLGGVLVLGRLAKAAQRRNPDEGLQTLEVH
jgi:hypothetical protein